MRRKWTFSKLLLLLESAVVLYTTYEGFALARLAVGYGYLGTLPWVSDDNANPDDRKNNLNDCHSKISLS